MDWQPSGAHGSSHDSWSCAGESEGCAIMPDVSICAMLPLDMSMAAMLPMLSEPTCIPGMVHV